MIPLKMVYITVPKDEINLLSYAVASASHAHQR